MGATSSDHPIIFSSQSRWNSKPATAAIYADVRARSDSDASYRYPRSVQTTWFHWESDCNCSSDVGHAAQLDSLLGLFVALETNAMARLVSVVLVAVKVWSVCQSCTAARCCHLFGRVADTIHDHHGWCSWICRCLGALAHATSTLEGKIALEFYFIESASARTREREREGEGEGEGEGKGR